jgi:hypothetical protein
LLSPASPAGERSGAKPICTRTARGAREIWIPFGWFHRDARARPPADRGISAGHAFDRDSQSEIEGVKETAAGEESKLPRFWYPRFYDFNIYKSKKIREKLEYMHSNPVTRGLVEDPIDWAWSSYPFYSGRGTPMIKIDFVL